jgi:hypothetical protein
MRPSRILPFRQSHFSKQRERPYKLKKLKPWYYEHCYVCGSDEKSDGDLLLCDGQDGRSSASHAIDATLFPWSRRLDGVESHQG